MAETKMAWRSLILFKCNAAWNRHIDERCHITRTKWYIRAADASSFQTFGISAPVYQTSKLDRSIDRSIDKPWLREENNSPLGERNFASMFSFPVTRPTRLRFPRFPTCTLFLFFARLLPQEREETLGRWELKLKNRSPRRPLWTRSTWTTLFSFFCYTLLDTSMAFISLFWITLRTFVNLIHKLYLNYTNRRRKSSVWTKMSFVWFIKI